MYSKKAGCIFLALRSRNWEVVGFETEGPSDIIAMNFYVTLDHNNPTKTNKLFLSLKVPKEKKSKKVPTELFSKQQN